jgi:DNA-binding CsgD family transcriptional regulator
MDRSTPISTAYLVRKRQVQRICMHMKTTASGARFVLMTKGLRTAIASHLTRRIPRWWGGPSRMYLTNSGDTLPAGVHINEHPFPAHGSSRGDARTTGPADAMATRDRAPAFLGRRRERQALDQLLDTVRVGQSQVLVLRGEAGVGKSALLDYLTANATGCRVARATGVESETPLAYAGLHQLSGPMLDLRERLPAPQRDALARAFSLSAGPAPDRFVVGLATLSLLSEIARERPLICVVDDAHWLDNATARALAFVARRLQAEAIGLVIAVPRELREFSGFPELAIGGLHESDALALLESALPGRLDERVRDRIVCESQGNPLALLDLAHGVGPAEFAGGFALPDVLAPENRIEQILVRRLKLLPVETRQLLLIAATEPLGEVSLLWRAASRLGLRADAAAPAQAAGLIDIGSFVRFSHPLLRSAVYRQASLGDRQEAHRALAEATDLDADPDRRAWHRAHAVDAPDEGVAAELERSAGWAATRGGVAAAAAFLGRASDLTPDPTRRGQRALKAAQAKLQAGGFEQAISMLDTGETSPLDELRSGRVDLTRARIAFARGRYGEAAPLLLNAARTLGRHDVGLAREAYQDALRAAMFAGHTASGPSVLEVARAARAAPTPSQVHTGDMLLDALVVRLIDSDAAAVECSKKAVRAFCDGDISSQEELRLLWLTSATAADLWDDAQWDTFTARHVKIARESGALSELPLALTSRVYVHLFAGELEDASSLVQEAQTVGEAIGSLPVTYGAIGLAAWHGREDEFHRLTDTMSDTAGGGERTGATVTNWCRAFLFNGLCRYEDALAAAREEAKYPQAVSAPNWGSIELIEAAARCGATELAIGALERLSETTSASGTDWALGIEARSRALLSDVDDAERLYCQAIEHLGRTRIRVDLARAHLLYGEWLRREGRRVDAREQLHTAQDTFAAIGMEAFAERARRELVATGGKVRKRSVETRGQLTPQEEQIARLARNLSSNPEIGAQLFISVRTVEWHLHNVFTKLGISSREQLRMALPEGDLPVTGA